jgi:hypothetical protein
MQDSLSFFGLVRLGVYLESLRNFGSLSRSPRESVGPHERCHRLLIANLQEPDPSRATLT